jgi:DNA-binding MarR family transcriptional regulator
MRDYEAFDALEDRFPWWHETRANEKVLIAVATNPSRSITKLGEMAGLARATASRALKRLTGAKLVHKYIGADNRAHLAELTPAGEKLYQDIVNATEGKAIKLTPSWTDASGQVTEKL